MERAEEPKIEHSRRLNQELGSLITGSALHNFKYDAVHKDCLRGRWLEDEVHRLPKRTKQTDHQSVERDLSGQKQKLKLAVDGSFDRTAVRKFVFYI